uniref:Maelstrom domain-containing protein n=1 Tax=Anolis carolinensis TaxID=28377 RepID=G1KVA0_ANOCA
MSYLILRTEPYLPLCRDRAAAAAAAAAGGGGGGARLRLHLALGGPAMSGHTRARGINQPSQQHHDLHAGDTAATRALSEDQKEKYAEIFLNILSRGMLPRVCSQHFLPCEIGCIKYSLKKGIIAEFHCFIDPGEVPQGFRFHCQAAADATHKVPISGLDFPATDCSVLLCELYTFIQPCWGTWLLIYCKSDYRYRVNWCLKHMAEVNHLELRNVEELIVELYSQKLQEEPSKTWVCSTLDASMWDYSANTRCQWHEEIDVIFCALATCKQIV